jgi:hypothetical protein
MTTIVHLRNHLKMIVQTETCSGMCNTTDYEHFNLVVLTNCCVDGYEVYLY